MGVFYGIDKRLASGLHPDISAVLVYFQRQVRFAVHLLLEEFSDVRIRSAVKIGQIDREEVLSPADIAGCRQNLLPRAPVHIRIIPADFL